MFSKNFNTYNEHGELCHDEQILLHYCDLYGYTIASGLNDVLMNKKLKKLHINMYANNPYILFLKTEAEDAEMISDENRFIIRGKGADKSTIMNIFKNDVNGCIYKMYDSSRCEIVFTLGNIFYRIFATIVA